MQLEPEMGLKKRTFGVSMTLDLESDLIKFGKIFDPPRRATWVLRLILEKWQEWYHQQESINPDEMAGWKFAPERIEMFKILKLDEILPKVRSNDRPASQ